jgi:hypothetical protein
VEGCEAVSQFLIIRRWGFLHLGELLDSHRLRSLECQAYYIALLYVTVSCDFRCITSKKCVHIPIYFSSKCLGFSNDTNLFSVHSHLSQGPVVPSRTDSKSLQLNLPSNPLPPPPHPRPGRRSRGKQGGARGRGGG